MATSYSFVSASAVTTPVINSTKVIVIANVACYANINGVATTTSNAAPMIPANIKTSINMQGIGNYLSLLSTNGTAAITVTQVGAVAASGIGGPLPINGNTYTNG
jgi:hypothetical protein